MTSNEIDHGMLFEKLVDHDGKITRMSKDIHGINEIVVHVGLRKNVEYRGLRLLHQVD